MLQPNASTPARIAAFAIEEVIRKNTTETGVLIAPDGSPFMQREGRPNKVSFPHWALLGAKGMTLTHNHPNGYPHSLQDIALGMYYELHEVRVVTPAFRYVASMLRPENRYQLTKHFPHVEAGVMEAVHDDVKRGKLNLLDFGQEVRHRTWQRLSAQLGFDYRRHA